MDITNASEILSGIILLSFGLLVMATTLVIINNILAKYWKTVNLVTWVPRAFSETPRFVEPPEQEKIPPTLDSQ